MQTVQDAMGSDVVTLVRWEDTRSEIMFPLPDKLECCEGLFGVSEAGSKCGLSLPKPRKLLYLEGMLSLDWEKDAFDGKSRVSSYTPSSAELS